jgi:hypothetical protein
MFVIPVFMIVMALMCAFVPYFLARPKLRNQDIMSSADYVGGALIEAFLITFIQASSLYIGMGLYNDIAAKSPTKLAVISTMEVWIVLTVIVLGAVPPAYLFIRQLNKIKSVHINP